MFTNIIGKAIMMVMKMMVVVMVMVAMMMMMVMMVMMMLTSMTKTMMLLMTMVMVMLMAVVRNVLQNKGLHTCTHHRQTHPQTEDVHPGWDVDNVGKTSFPTFLYSDVGVSNDRQIVADHARNSLLRLKVVQEGQGSAAADGFRDLSIVTVRNGHNRRGQESRGHCIRGARGWHRRLLP